MLKDYPRRIGNGPTANLVSGQLVVCSEGSCDTFEGGEWNHLVDTLVPTRILSSSAVNDHRMLLIGGLLVDPDNSDTTEWIPVDGSPAQPGPFKLRVYDHCAIQTAPDRIVITGGIGTGIGANGEDYVVEHELTGDFTETPLTPMRQGRFAHACGGYKGVDGQQVRRVLIVNFTA